MAQPPIKTVNWNAQKPQLSEGAIQALSNMATCTKLTGTPLWLQVLTVKKIQAATSNEAKDRHRLVISDGLFHTSVILATQLNQLVESGNLQERSIVRIQQWTVSQVRDKRFTIITQLEVLISAFPLKIGEPQAIPGQEPEAVAAKPAASPAPLPQPAAPRAVQQPPPMARPPAPAPVGGRPASAPMNVDSNTRITPISQLNMYGPPAWVIKAKCTSKSEVRQFTSARGPGQVFNVELQDADGGEIRAASFGDAVNVFEPIFQVGKVFFISRGSVRSVTKKFGRIKNDFEIQLDTNSQVIPAPESENFVAHINYDFVSISDLGATPAGTVVDIIGTIMDVGEVATINTKRGMTPKRTITIADDSRTSIGLTLWGKSAETFDPQLLGQIVAVKGAMTGDYGGKSLTGGQLDATVDNPAAQRIRIWVDTEGTSNVVPLTQGYQRGGGAAGGAAAAGGGGGGGAMPERTFNEITLENVPMDDPDPKNHKIAFQARATVSHIKHQKDSTFYYRACSKCKKKVTQDDTGYYRCLPCNTPATPTPDIRYTLNLMLLDQTGSLWVSLFDEQSEKLVGVPAKQIVELMEANKEGEVDRIFMEAQFKTFTFKLIAKKDEYQGRAKLKTTCISLVPDSVETNKELAAKLAEYGVQVDVTNADSLTALLP